MKIKWLFLSIWLLSIVAFVAGQLLAPSDYALLPGNPWGSLFGFSVVIGIISFILMLTFLIMGKKRNNRPKTKETKKKPFISRFLRFILIIIFLPFFLLFKVIQPKQLFQSMKSKGIWKTFDLGGLIVKTIFSLVIIGASIGGYGALWLGAKQTLGYNSRDINITGTGSMYPTWPKGTKGKDPKELGKEIVSSAGFLPYPNGLVLGGQRYFDHKITRGDIVTAQNDEIGKVTEKIYGTPSGVLKRVIALGGDSIELKDGIVYLNNNPLKEQYIAKPHSTFGEEFLKECQKYTIPNDSTFLMGDNRKGSGDSREFGPVKYSEIKSVLPLSKQKGTLDRNWHDATNDLADVAKPKIDRNRFVELLNQKRKENGASPIKYEPKLEVSAKTRGEYMLAHDSLAKNVSYDTIVNAMSKTGYWNSYVWEWRIEGYYEADELIEDYIERDSSDAKDVWFDKKFDDIGIAEVRGTLNGCPTQIIVVHAAGYVPPNYKQSDIDSWQVSLDSLKGIQAGWAELKNNNSFYSQHKADVDRINEIINTRISRIGSIISTMRANKWLSSEQNRWIKEDQSLYNEEGALANKLNGR